MSIKKTVINEYKNEKISIIIKYESTICEFLKANCFPLDSVVHYNNRLLNRDLNQKWKGVTDLDKKKSIKVAPHALDGNY